MSLSKISPVETAYLDIGPENAARIVRDSRSETRTLFGEPQYSEPTISHHQATLYARHSLEIEICGVKEQQIEVRSSLPNRLLKLGDPAVIPDQHLVEFLAKPIARVDGLTAQHSENYQQRIRGIFPDDRLEPNDYETTVSNWMKGTIRHRFDQLCLYMNGRHTWDELVDYWQRLLLKVKKKDTGE